MAATCAITVAADAAALHWIGGTGVSVGRCLRVAAFSVLMSQPLRSAWSGLLDVCVGTEGDELQGIRVLRKILDRAVFTPLLLCLFFSFMRLSEGMPHAVLPSLKAKLLPCLLANWCGSARSCDSLHLPATILFVPY